MQEFGNAKLYVLKNKHGLIMQVSDLGATLQSLLVPDRNGKLLDVVLGYDRAEEYLQGSEAFGATVGRNANRIGGASFSLNGEKYHLHKNNGENNLHSGNEYYHFRKWQVVDVRDNHIRFSLDSPDGDQGYPGNLHMQVSYTLSDDNELIIEYYGVPDQDTIINLTNHSYFNLNGHESGDVLDHEVWVNADSYLVTDKALIPTGEIAPVADTPMEFREKKILGKNIQDDFEALVFGEGYDHNWCLNNHGHFEKVAELSSKQSGITMEVYTDLPGLQMYTANSLQREPGKIGVLYDKYQGVCFETQYYPDAIHHKHFPSAVCKKNHAYKTKTTYKFIQDI